MEFIRKVYKGSLVQSCICSFCISTSSTIFTNRNYVNYHFNKRIPQNPAKFRIKHQDELDILGPNRKDRFAINEDLPTITTTSKIAIIGAGFGGMAGAIKTMNKYDEHDIQIFERHDNFGGTWYANTYPGCASDIPAFGIHSHLR